MTEGHAPWLEERENGIYVFSAGPAWDGAYNSAVSYLRAAAGNGVRDTELHKVLLGPRVPRTAYFRLLHDFLGADGVNFGKRVGEWSEWVTQAAREEKVLRGEPFREFPLPARREFLRNLLAMLEDRGMLAAASGRPGRPYRSV